MALRVCQRVADPNDDADAADHGSAASLAILEHATTCARVEADWLAGIMQRISGKDETGADRLAGRGMMLLSGDLRNFHLPDLIRLLASGGHTGTLSVTDGQALRTMTFQGGKPVCATSEWVSGAPTRDGREDFVVPPSDCVAFSASLPS
jgi:hypothetical protein